MTRSAGSLFLLVLTLLLLSRGVAMADPLDLFSVTTGDVDIKFSLPASITLPNSIPDQYLPPVTQGTVNGTPYDISLHFIFPGNCSVCDTLFVYATPASPNIGASLNDEFGLPDLYQFGPFTYPPSSTVTVNFIPGVYPTSLLFSPIGFEPATITVVPESAPVTPEPSTPLLLGTATLASIGLLPRRLVS